MSLSRLFNIILLIVISHCAFPMGAVWVLEIKFKMDGQLQHAYFDASFNTDDFIESRSHQKLFEAAFRERYGAKDSITVFEKIIDHERIAEVASFPMLSFHLVESSAKQVSLSEISEIELVKIWRKDEYWIDVLTKLVDADTSWIGSKANVEYPIGNEVGCRLEVHKFGPASNYKNLIDEFIGLYQLEKPRSHQNQGRFHQLLAELKEQKIVVVELCGC